MSGVSNGSNTFGVKVAACRGHDHEIVVCMETFEPC
jgi:hypothetical protein